MTHPAAATPMTGSDAHVAVRRPDTIPTAAMPIGAAVPTATDELRDAVTYLEDRVALVTTRLEQAGLLAAVPPSPNRPADPLEHGHPVPYAGALLDLAARVRAQGSRLDTLATDQLGV